MKSIFRLTWADVELLGKAWKSLSGFDKSDSSDLKKNKNTSQTCAGMLKEVPHKPILHTATGYLTLQILQVTAHRKVTLCVWKKEREGTEIF